MENIEKLDIFMTSVLTQEEFQVDVFWYTPEDANTVINHFEKIDDKNKERFLSLDYSSMIFLAKMESKPTPMPGAAKKAYEESLRITDLLF